MNTQKKAPKKLFIAECLQKMFFGNLFNRFGREEHTVENERYDSPTKLAVKRFFRKPLATAAVIVLISMFLFVFIGPAIDPVDLSYMESAHANVAPNMSMMKLPAAMKEGAVSITSNGSFTLGLDKDGNVHLWGYYGTTSKEDRVDVMKIPEEVQKADIRFAAAGSDHCIAIGDDGTVYGWGVYDNGQYSHDGTLLAMSIKQPSQLLNGTINVDNVKQLVCGNQVTAVLMKDGTLHAWGNYQTGAPNMKSVVKLSKETNDFAEIAFTNSGMFALTNDGKFITGDSAKYDNYQLVDEDGKTKVVNVYEHIGNRKIVDIAASGDSIVLLTDDHEVITLGTVAKAPKLPENEKIVSVSAGTRHFALLTDNGKVYAWGNGKLGQTAVPEKLTIDGAVDMVVASGFQTYAFKDGKFVGSWGLKGYAFGTDNMGRDVFNRVMNGGRMTMTIGAVAVIVATIIGVIIGCISGYFGGWVDMFLMRVTEIFGAIPFLPFALVLSAILQASNLTEDTRIFIIMVILGLLSWTGLARLVRGQVLAEREKEFVTAAKSMGVSQRRIAFKHILPNVISVILVSVTLDFATCMLTESTLSYLGFGVQLPRPTWGNMLDGCRNSVVIQNYWWRWLFPAIFLSITVICINIIGDTLRDVLDPKSEVEK